MDKMRDIPGTDGKYLRNASGKSHYFNGGRSQYIY